MDKQINNYLKVFNDLIPSNVCQETIVELKKQEDKFHTHKFYHPNTDQSISYINELSVAYLNLETKEILMSKVWDGISQYMKFLKEKGLGDVYSEWEGYSEIRFNKYDINTQMKRHVDHIKTIFNGDRRGIPILSVICALNDDYKGGELVFWNDEVINLKAGDLMIFPSNFLYPHQVKLITEGVRYSFVSWVW